MATIITGRQLQEAVTRGDFLKGGDPSCAEDVKYDFRLSPKILKAKFRTPVDANRLSEAERRDLLVEPGEVVFVLTEERLALPADMVAQLSPKRKLSHAGILTLGGFCVDPGYEGRLLLGLFNLSSTPFPLRPGKKLIAATFYKLEESEAGLSPRPMESLDDFPDELVQVMQRYHPVAVHSVVDTVKKLEDELLALRNDIRSHEEWYRRFKESLQTNNEQIGRLTQDLQTEKEMRKSGQDEITSAVQSIEKTLSFLKGVAWVFLGIMGIAVSALVIPWISKTFFGNSLWD